MILFKGIGRYAPDRANNRVLVGVDDTPRQDVLSAQGIGQKALGDASAWRLADRRKAMLAPVESVARYK
jgi:hypothetical protein